MKRLALVLLLAATACTGDTADPDTNQPVTDTPPCVDRDDFRGQAISLYVEGLDDSKEAALAASDLADFVAPVSGEAADSYREAAHLFEKAATYDPESLWEKAIHVWADARGAVIVGTKAMRQAGFC